MRAGPSSTTPSTAPSTTPSFKPKWGTRVKNGLIRFFVHSKNAILYSWVNVLLVFVPIGIAVYLAHMNPAIVFAMNAIAIVPLAGLLSHATEAVAARVGDAVGALLNISFGNAVELILFIILLADNQIRVVQAALLGSILANLLLILGMAFLLGGLKYQEQFYNNTVTQMSACMLCLAVMSLLLPTAFHAAFSDNRIADTQTLHISRGTSVILLLIYILYLLFQLKSHSYMYVSTPQHVIDEESHPGILADFLNSSSSSESDEEYEGFSGRSSRSSHTTARRIRRAFRHHGLRRSSQTSGEITANASAILTNAQAQGSSQDEARISRFRDPASERDILMEELSADRRQHIMELARWGRRLKPGKRKKAKTDPQKNDGGDIDESTNRVDFAEHVQTSEPTNVGRRLIPMPSLFSSNVFTNPQNPPPPPEMAERGAPLMSRTAAIVMLLISTALVAVCADFLTESIEPMVAKSNVSEAFIGLIILPMVGNAAEHVTAVTVAAKNKMNLAIGIAVGSSIQIAIFITPVIVILGWILNKEMSLYFNIFETVALFVTAFVVNFLVLDGRSNYLEGSLLIAAYVIIALSSFFYPDRCDALQIGGQEGAC
ncbi:calcium/proton exchanger [Sporormia fimetaria CBS 119925]|uniref:Calcium/proton exchanger n=1 Tax=Sporormia fimetaria CBS 119925 TaxID=1340428 RepID=A0A6A6V2F8_9PLEO|nr:calcium/proton exchanger [Sporormia fimetaria CBS 119925]